MVHHGSQRQVLELDSVTCRRGGALLAEKIVRKLLAIVEQQEQDEPPRVDICPRCGPIMPDEVEGKRLQRAIELGSNAPGDPEPDTQALLVPGQLSLRCVGDVLAAFSFSLTTYLPLMIMMPACGPQTVI